ncbi:MAG: DegV family protein [Acholeplasmatales bacterium]|jgi:DegV family protein with EDD domain|nr:DegV family protein [Acholeplasmatales bacterium]
MKDFEIISDGSCDLSDEAVSKLGIRVVPFYVAYDEESYLKEKVDFQVQEFYQKLMDNPGVFPKTSMPTAEDYCQEFQKAFELNKNILCITISKKFSGSLNSALMARDMFLEEHPDARVEVVDSTVNSCTQGLLVREIARMRENGLTLDEVLSKIEEIKVTGRSYFTINGLSYLQHGGRIGKLTAIVGNILKVTPLIVQKDGEIQSGGIALSRKRAIMKIFDKFKSTLHKHNLSLEDYLIVVGYGNSLEEGMEFAKKFEEIFGKKVELFDQIGATIAVHTGPYPIGIAFIRKYDA